MGGAVVEAYRGRSCRAARRRCALAPWPVAARVARFRAQWPAGARSAGGVMASWWQLAAGHGTGDAPAGASAIGSHRDGGQLAVRPVRVFPSASGRTPSPMGEPGSRARHAYSAPSSTTSSTTASRGRSWDAEGARRAVAVSGTACIRITRAGAPRAGRPSPRVPQGESTPSAPRRPAGAPLPRRSPGRWRARRRACA